MLLLFGNSPFSLNPALAVGAGSCTLQTGPPAVSLPLLLSGAPRSELTLNAAAATATGTLMLAGTYSGVSLPLLFSLAPPIPGVLTMARSSGQAAGSVTLALTLSLTGSATAAGHASVFIAIGGQRGLNTAVTVIASTGDFDHNAFPGFAKMANGNLITVYRKGTSHGSSTGDLIKRTSTDNGATWSVPTTIRDVTKDCRDVALTVLANGRVGVVFNEDTYLSTTDEHAYVMWSDDNGATWGTPVLLPFAFTGYNVDPGTLIECANGDIIAMGYGVDGARTGPNTYYIKLCRSTDGGNTFTLQGTVVPLDGVIEWAEPYMARLSNGEIMCTIRVLDTADVEWAGGMWSSDNGLTWTPMVRLFSDAAAPHTILQTPDGDVVALSRNWSPIASRTYWPEYRQSWDFGRTWTAPVVFTGGTTAGDRTYLYGQWATLNQAGGNAAVGIVWAQGYSGAADPDGAGESRASVFFRTLTAPAPSPVLVGLQAHAVATGSLTLTSTSVPLLTPTGSATATGRLTVRVIHPLQLNLPTPLTVWTSTTSLTLKADETEVLVDG